MKEVMLEEVSLLKKNPVKSGWCNCRNCFHPTRHSVEIVAGRHGYIAMRLVHMRLVNIPNPHSHFLRPIRTCSECTQGAHMPTSV